MNVSTMLDFWGEFGSHIIKSAAHNLSWTQLIIQISCDEVKGEEDKQSKIKRFH